MYLLHTSTLESSFDKKADFKPKSISREEERKKREKMSQDISFSLLLPCTRIPRPSLLPFFSLPLISFLERRLPHSLTLASSAGNGRRDERRATRDWTPASVFIRRATPTRQAKRGRGTGAAECEGRTATETTTTAAEGLVSRQVKGNQKVARDSAKDKRRRRESGSEFPFARNACLATQTHIR